MTTEYNLHFYVYKDNSYSADVYETHCGTSKGCFETDKVSLQGIEADSLAELFIKVEEYIVDFENECNDFNDTLVGVSYYNLEDRQ